MHEIQKVSTITILDGEDDILNTMATEGWDDIEIRHSTFSNTRYITIKLDGIIEVYWSDWGHSGGRVIKIKNKEDFDILYKALMKVETSESFNFFNGCMNRSK